MASLDDKLLDGSGLGILGSIIDQKIDQASSGGGGIDWSTTPYTTMSFFSESNGNVGVVLFETELLNAMVRTIRLVLIANYKAQVSTMKSAKVVIPSGLLTKDPGIVDKTTATIRGPGTGSGVVSTSYTINQTSCTVKFNPSKVAITPGLYIGQAMETVMLT